MTNNGNWNTDNDDSFLNHAREDLEKAVEQMKAGWNFPPIKVTPEEWKTLQEPRDYMGEYYSRPGDSLLTRFKKWRKRRQMKRMLRNVTIRDGGVFGRYKDD